MSRKVGIIVSLVLALLMTGLIVSNGNKAYREVSKTVDVLVATRDIPADAKIKESDVKSVSIPESMAGNWLTDSSEVTDKVAAVGILKGNYINPYALRTGAEMAPGNVGIMIAVDLASSAGAEAGDLVDIHVVDRHEHEGSIAPIVVESVKVLRTVISDGTDKPLTPEDQGLVGGSTNQSIAAVSLEVPKDKAETVVYYAAQKGVYLVKSDKGAK